jgi:hypothetical protein
MLERKADWVARDRKHPLAVSALISHQRLKGRHCATWQRNVAGVAIFGQRQMSDATNEVDVLPLKIEHFPTTHRGLDGQND